LERAIELCDAAIAAGVDAIKLQTYTPDTMTLDITGGEFSIPDDTSLWNGRSLHDLYEEAHTPWAWHQEIFAHCAPQRYQLQLTIRRQCG